MKRLMITVVVVGVSVCVRAAFAGEVALKDLVQHFKQSGLPLDQVDYQTITDDQKKIGIVEGINVEDDERKRPQITKPLYMFTVLRQKDQESLLAHLQFARSFQNETYTNDLLLLTFPKHPPLNPNTKEKIIAIFRSFSAGSSVDDEWVAQSTFQTAVGGSFIAADAAIPVGGQKIEYRDRKLPWLNSMEGHTGVAILHPLSQQNPAVITYTPKWLFNPGDTLVLAGRGSNAEPGVRIVVKWQGAMIAEEVVNSKWRKLTIPLPKNGGQRTPITIEVWPMGWAYEYFYLDNIEIQKQASVTTAAPLPTPQPLPARPPMPSNNSLRRLIIKALVDGKSALKVQGGKLWWAHQTCSPPGKWDGRNEPTMINDQVWIPEWDANISKPLAQASPFIPSLAREVRLRKIKGRGLITVLEQPTANNNYTLAVLFDDSKPGGADWYEIELYW